VTDGSRDTWGELKLNSEGQAKRIATRCIASEQSKTMGRHPSVSSVDAQLGIGWMSKPASGSINDAPNKIMCGSLTWVDLAGDSVKGLP
jgi:hypothetical protein